MASSRNLLGKRNLGDDLETKQLLKKHKVTSEEKEAALLTNTLSVTNISNQIKIPEILDFLKDFFKDVGRVVHIQLVIDPDKKDRCMGFAFVQFASANETKKALEKKSGVYLLDREIRLRMADIPSLRPQPKCCIDHNLWYEEDYFRRDEDDPPPDFAEEVVLVANLSPQTQISDIYNFFDDVGVVISVRLIVNHEGKHLGYAFVEFLSSNEAKKVLEKKNGEYLHGHKIFLMKGHGNTCDFVEEVAIRQTKRIFLTRLSPQTMLSDIIDFFKDVGEVVHVRLIVSQKGKGSGLVEFASANEAKNAVEKKNGEILQGSKISVYLARKDPLSPPKLCIDHMVWFEDYLRREGLLTEEDEAVKGLTETSDFVEEARKKTLFVANLPHEISIKKIKKFFGDVAEVVRVRLLVDHRGKHVGCGFVEFASANEAEKALEQKNGKSLRYKSDCGKIFLDVAKMAPYPLRPKYKLPAKLWHEDNILGKPNLKQHMEKCKGFCGTKITFPSED